MSADDLISRLDKARPNGDGKWIACCPAHEDRDPSLSISELKDGRVLVRCFAGCSALDVITAVGLTWGSLFPPSAERYRPALSRPKDAAQERAVLDLCARDRAQGRRLSKADKLREREAWMRLRGVTA